MDISDTLAPNSEQLDAVDLLGGPRIFTITKVDRGNAEQPINIHLDGFPRVWRPGKSMRRVLVAAWGPDASKYAGRRVELFCDPDVKFGGQAVGGTRISRLSHIDKPAVVPLLVTRGKSAMFTVRSLPDDATTAAGEPTAEQVTACTDPAQLRTWWKTSRPARRAQIEARVTELTSTPADSQEQDASDDPWQLPDRPQED